MPMYILRSQNQSFSNGHISWTWIVLGHMFKNQRCLSKNNINCQPTCITNLEKKKKHWFGTFPKQGALDDDVIKFNLAFWECPPLVGLHVNFQKKDLLYLESNYILLQKKKLPYYYLETM